MELIVITRPEMLPGEATIINQLFARGLARLHVRKPGATEAELRALLELIEPRFRGRVALHHHHELANDYGITGLHFTENNRLTQSEGILEKSKSNGFTISTSIHDPKELETLAHCFDYAFLGPVFDSISKEGYSSNLPAGFRLQKHNFPNEVIALGGIHAQNLKSALEMGFDSAAVLGSIWQNPDNAIAQFENLKSLQLSLKSSQQSSFQQSSFQQSSCIPGLKPGAIDLALEMHAFAEKQIKPKAKAVHCPGFQPGDPEKKDEAGFVDRLHFISNETGTMSHIDSIRLALEAGCQWIQLRVKNRAEEEVLPIAWEATQLCDRYGARLIINDFPRVALAVQSFGLHLGLTDMPVPEARMLVGEKMVIGGTANTWDDIVRRINEGADYIGLGPFRFTNTKQNLSPILGIDGYRTLMLQMREAGHSTPIIAIGGITPDDIGGLREAGLHGVAMSGALIGATDPQKTFYQIQQALC
ncbi:thiamine-phosphate pyrophosphorylase [Dyadobacter sp. BE34]|uniref:Thiamine-phosphate synthase n=1 Tax=Dyadobacter fermentans TaxID=94254 RepID=A0ABU1R2C6_9BACT|nr:MULTISPECIES: thiamine phosphate synthase [Dyadobacter]MDR6807392.1 thiamine-phosphate pyrophosphorylase [Dyadobacter fermentans]MDR7045133.1 thiamine-phosphate pyrophosphorylase [Dyadobacter sp. BE242]MDR7199130.1 thiamine-phosphate pyrophosphorylase [Dyadobacter sp. BE34]MDR7217090.1 thiamine-phosphate pyrophosphorylase [Dyadobacter sp. BE31]MDR7265023.1 thiamine-phosphate pyrophosphorylase [Dyadobacter sp. BE32]